MRDGSMGTTNWTFVLKFNTYLFLVMSALLITSFIGLCRWQVYSCVNTLLGCGNFVLWICIFLTGVNRFSVNGDTCALNESVYDEASGASWASDAATIRALFVAQATLSLPMMCTVCVGLCAGKLIG